MAHILAHDPIRVLPIYRDGFNAGQDLGLRIALDAITAERIRQERLDSGSQACRVYAEGALLAVAKVVAARFRPVMGGSGQLRQGAVRAYWD